MEAVREMKSGGRRMRWLYLLVAVPTLTEVLEDRGFATTPSGYITDLVMTILVALVVTVVIRQHEGLARRAEELVRTTTQLQHADRLATVGQLAAGVAHELGSPLQVVAGRARMIASGEAAEREAKESGQVIFEQAQRMTEIIRGLLGFARRRPAQRSAIELQDVVTETVRILAPLAKKKAVVLNTQLDGPGAVQADVGQIQQALTNIVMNAIQVVGEGGHIEVALEDGRDHACLRVTDDGPGIPEQDVARVFEPFFTTKDVGEGTGLGLAIAHGLVGENGGWIAVESELGRGSSFSICLPLRAAAGGATP